MNASTQSQTGGTRQVYQLLRDEDDTSGAIIPYTTAIPEYRVVLIEKSWSLTNGEVLESSHLEKSWGLTNGHNTIDLQHPVRYEMGDHVGVHSENIVETIEAAARLLGLYPDTLFSIHSDNDDGTPLKAGSLLAPPFPSTCTLRTALSRYADLLNFSEKILKKSQYL